MAAFPAGNAFPVPDCRDVFHHLRPASLDSGSRPENDRANGFRACDAPYNSLRHGDHLSRFGNRVGHVPAFHSLFRLLAPAHLPPGMGCPAHWRKTHQPSPAKCVLSFILPVGNLWMPVKALLNINSILSPTSQTSGKVLIWTAWALSVPVTLLTLLYTLIHPFITFMETFVGWQEEADSFPMGPGRSRHTVPLQRHAGACSVL